MWNWVLAGIWARPLPMALTALGLSRFDGSVPCASVELSRADLAALASILKRAVDEFRVDLQADQACCLEAMEGIESLPRLPRRRRLGHDGPPRRAHAAGLVLELADQRRHCARRPKVRRSI